jgi:hypothetical protein
VVAGAGARRTGELVAALALAAAAVACSGDDADDADGTADPVAEVVTTSTAPARPTTTTSLVYDPSTVEGQVEAAYLKSWDVYADAVYNLTLDEAALASVYAGEHLGTVQREIARRIAEGRASLVRREMRIHVDVGIDDTAVVFDDHVNHQVLIDPATKTPVEADPQERNLDVVTLRRIDGVWRVVHYERRPAP